MKQVETRCIGYIDHEERRDNSNKRNIYIHFKFQPPGEKGVHNE